jgi:TM2 domain-containing membrane protein YozV
MADEPDEKLAQPDPAQPKLAEAAMPLVGSEPFANMPIDAAVDAAVAAVDAAASDGNFDPTTDLRPCPECETLLKPWQVTCHNCGRDYAKNIDVHRAEVEEVVHQAAELEESYKDWLEKGNAALSSERYGEAQTCFLEALARSKALPNPLLREIEVRKGLAKALEKLDKKGEATEQYMLLSRLNQDARAGLAEEFTKRARQLSLSTMDILSAVDKNASFRPPVGSEIRLAPLYCGQCKRILLEAEIYHVRKGRAQRVRCFCGAEGVPLVRSDAKHLRALKTASSVRKRKAQLIQAASDYLPDGHQQRTAMVLAAVLGGFGAHKFYLGEKVPGMIYLAFCWTFVPTVIGWFEAINYSQMSRVTFNLMYNVEQVIMRLPMEEEDDLSHDHSDVFSMEITEDEPEEFVDQFTSSKESSR